MILTVGTLAVLAGPGVAFAHPVKGITGAGYSFSASAGPASVSKGSGTLRKTGNFLAVVRGKRRSSTFASRVTLWSIDRRTPTQAPNLPKTTLLLTVKVTSSIGGCRVGTRGTVVLVDWNKKLDSGRTSDRVTVRFPAGPCRPLAGTWSNANGDRVRVAITVRS